ncbi:MAG: ThuA domain-containing protein [Bacteroidia bacterium]|nr:ThuA domain-containing protein [Bacteroidia bacterium]
MCWNLRLNNTFLIGCILFFQDSELYGQKILHFTATSGYDHQTRLVSYQMFDSIGQLSGIQVDNDSTGLTFNSLIGLLQYDAIVFSNTSGNAILTPQAMQHFEWYIQSGGNLLGIHSASDTYRHSTANGNNTGTWDFFPEVLGASVQQFPSHVAGIPLYRIDQSQPHPVLNFLPDPWFKEEEYYYWEQGYFDSSVNVLQKVEATVGPNGLVNSYDSSRAVTWVRFTQAGGKIFYTSLGHSPTNFTSDSSFIRLIRNAVGWLTGTLSFPFTHYTPCKTALHKVSVQALSVAECYDDYKFLLLFSAEGKLVYSGKQENNIFLLSSPYPRPGIYFFRLLHENKEAVNGKIILYGD